MTTYEVMFKIERITFGCEPLAIGNVTFQNLTSAIVETWKADSENALLSLFDDAGNQPIGIVKVDDISDANKAAEYALDEFDRALNILRVCVGSFRSTTIYDEQLLQRRNGLAAIRQVKPQPQLVGISPGRKFGPIDLGLSGTLADSTNEFIGKLTPLYNGTIQCEIRDALLKSLERIGMSIARDHYDYKVVDILTALEVALIPKDDRSPKSISIALRTMLLSLALDNGYFVPSTDEVYRLYRLRNAIIHDADRGVCDDKDYGTLRRIAERTILSIIELNGKQGPIDDVRHLAKILETEEILKQAKACFEDWRNRERTEDAKEILGQLCEHANYKLNKMKPTTQHTSGQSE